MTVKMAPKSTVFPVRGDSFSTRDWPVFLNYDAEAQESVLWLRKGDGAREIRLDSTVVAVIRDDGYVVAIRMAGEQDGALTHFLPPEDPPA